MDELFVPQHIDNEEDLDDGDFDDADLDDDGDLDLSGFEFFEDSDGADFDTASSDETGSDGSQSPPSVDLDLGLDGFSGGRRIHGRPAVPLNYPVIDDLETFDFGDLFAGGIPGQPYDYTAGLYRYNVPAVSEGEVRTQLRQTRQHLRRVDNMADVIDLTGDSDGERARPVPISDTTLTTTTTHNNNNNNNNNNNDPNAGGNPRRRVAIRRTPSLTRSQGNLIDLTDDADEVPRARRPPVLIDLGSDDDLEEVPPPPAAARTPAVPPAPAVPGTGFGNLLNRLAGFGSLVGMHVHVAHAAAQHHHHHHHHHPGAPPPPPPPPNPLGNNFPNLNYGANGYNAGANRPPFVPPPPPRAGFSRDTGEDNIFVCPACEAELKYEPDEDGGGLKKARNRRDREEHHFWAVKECGHVFCKSCFANRRSVGGFRADGRKKVLCAVPDCAADVSAKAAWVGLFL